MKSSNQAVRTQSFKIDRFPSLSKDIYKFYWKNEHETDLLKVRVNVFTSIL